MANNVSMKGAGDLQSHATPISIDGQFGWIHTPENGDPARIGVVLCPAFGAEMLCAYAGWRDLAIRLADAGFPALRFDYDGTGNSRGDDREPDRLESWSLGIVAAIDGLRRSAGVDRVIVVGLRLGATLAAEVVAGRDDIAGFVALAPVVSGRVHARELTVLAQLGRLRPENGTPDADEIGGMGVSGFFVHAETLAGIKTLDLMRGDRSPASHILLLERARAANPDLSGRWHNLGSAVKTGTFEGYDAFMDSPTTAVSPVASWRCVIDWCRAVAMAEPATPLTSTVKPVPFDAARIVGDGWVEQAFHFGAGDRLFSILTRPQEVQAADAASDLAVIILNAGRNHHIGWARGSVEMARVLARQGATTLRIDAAGIGDSPAWPDGPEEVLYAAEQKADVAAAMDRLGSLGFSRFMLVGACGGAYLALHAAIADERVAGFTLINLLRFHWRKGDTLAVAMQQEIYRPTGSYLSRLRDREIWLRIMRGDVAIAGIARAILGRVWRKLSGIANRMLARFGLAQSPEAEAISWFRQLEARGVGMQMIYSAEDPALAELEQYFGLEGRKLTTAVNLEFVVIPNTDHNQSQRNARIQTVTLIGKMLARLR